MKCGCFIKPVMTPKGRISRILSVSWYHTDLGSFPTQKSAALIKDGYTICDGNIIPEIMATDEPYYGGTSAILEISYRCDKCTNNFYPELPDTSNINDFFKNVVSNLNEVEMRSDRLEKDREAERQRAYWLEESKRLDAERKAASAARKAKRDAKKEVK